MKCLKTLLVIALQFVGIAFAEPTVIVDTSSEIAVLDSTISEGEYAGFSSGINGGFGNVLGSNSRLFIDSSLDGTIAIGHQWSSGVELSQYAVMYIDTGIGGADVPSLSSLGLGAFSGDLFRQAIVGSNGYLSNDLRFGPGFGADYAIVWSRSFAGLWSLGDLALPFVSPLPMFSPGAPGGQLEMSFSLANIGLVPGDSFDYLATYLDPESIWRSNEFHGVRSTTVFAGNLPPGATTILVSGDFNTFQSVAAIPEPSSSLLLLMGMFVLVAFRSIGRRVAG